MEEAYVIGIRLALEDGVSAGLAAIQAELTTLDIAIGATASHLAQLRSMAAAADLHRLSSAGEQLLPPAPAPTPTAPPETPAERSPITGPAMTEEDRPRPSVANPEPPAPVRAPTKEAAEKIQPEPVNLRDVTVLQSPPQSPPPAMPRAPDDRPRPVLPLQPSQIEVAVHPNVTVVAPTSTPLTGGRLAVAAPPVAAPLRPDDRDPPVQRRETTPTAAAIPGPPVQIAQIAKPRGGPLRPPDIAAAAPPQRQAQPVPAIVALLPMPSPAQSAAPAPPAPAHPLAPSAPFAPTAPPQPPSVAVSPPAQPTGGPVFLDGHYVGRWMADHLAREVSRPASGTTAFDPRVSPSYPGALQGN